MWAVIVIDLIVVLGPASIVVPLHGCLQHESVPEGRSSLSSSITSGGGSTREDRGLSEVSLGSETRFKVWKMIRYCVLLPDCQINLLNRPLTRNDLTNSWIQVSQNARKCTAEPDSVSSRHQLANRAQ